MRGLVGLLAAATAMSLEYSLAHGVLIWVVLATAVTASGLAAYFALEPFKKTRWSNAVDHVATAADPVQKTW
jgi:hypothetical protein